MNPVISSVDVESEISFLLQQRLSFLFFPYHLEIGLANKKQCKWRKIQTDWFILDPMVLMSHLLIKTTCDRGSKSRDKKVFTFCQDGQCCSTSPLPFQNENCNEEHFYQGTEIGECTQFKFGFDN